MEEEDDTNNGRRWVVLAAAFLTLLLNTSIGYNVGVLNVAISDTFYGAPVETVSWLMAMYSSLFALGSPIGSTVVNLSSCRTCVILSGFCSFLGLLSSSFVNQLGWFFPTLFLAGLGQSLSQVGAVVSLVYSFPRRTALATGIALTGAGMGSFVHPALLQLLFDKYSLKGALLILSAISLHSIMLGLLMKPTEKELQRHQEKKSVAHRQRLKTDDIPSEGGWRTYTDIITDTRFLKVLVAVLTYAAAFQSTIVYMPEYLVMGKGFSRLDAATVASFIGIGTLISRPLVGFAATDSNIGELLMMVGLNFVSFLVCMAADGMMNYTSGAYIASLSLGLYTSSCNALIFPVVVHVLGYEKGASGYGIVMMVFGVASLVGPPSYAVVLKTFGYEALFRLSGFLFLVTAVVTIGTFRKTTQPEIEERIGEENRMISFTKAELGSQNFKYVVSPDKDLDIDHCKVPLANVDLDNNFVDDVS